MIESKFLSLSDITTGNACVVVKVHSHGSFRNRIMEMGFVKGEKVRVIRNAPLQDPIEYIIMGYHVSLRRSEASLIEVVKIDNNKFNESFCRGLGGHHHFGRHVGETIDKNELKLRDDKFSEGRGVGYKHGRTKGFSKADCEEAKKKSGCKRGRGRGRFWEEYLRDEVKQKIKEKSHLIEVALVGNPNCGKTSIFNRLTGLREKVGNYSGVTVGAKTATVKYKDYTIKFTDLPGTYSLTEYSAEEIYVRKYISEEHPDIVLNVVDSSNLERNLFLTSQLIDMNVKVVMAINMYDELISNGDILDYKSMGLAIGIPIVPTTAFKGIGIDKIFAALVESFEERAKELKHIHINYGTRVERAIEELKPELLKNPSITDLYVPRFLAIKLLEGDQIITEVFKGVPNSDELNRQVKDLRYNIENNKDENDVEQDVDVNDSDADVKELITNYKFAFVRSLLDQYFKSGKKDKHKLSSKIDDLLTHKVFGYIFLLIFMWIMFEATFTLGQYPMDWIDDGVTLLSTYLQGVMPVGPFTDLILDGILAGVGGVIQFLPNIVLLFLFISIMEDTGYMARAAFIMDKILRKIGLHGKSFIPLLTGFGCNVPAIMATRNLDNKKDRIITMLIIPFMSCSARLPLYVLMVAAFFPHNRGLILLSIYLIGLFIAVLTSLALNKFMFKKSVAPFVMELPPYRIPTAKNVLMHMWERASQYLKKISTIILFSSIIIWALGYFPLSTHQEGLTRAEQMEDSYIGHIGKAITPVIKPLGFDWKMGVSIVTGFAAKEIVVGSMAVLYHSSEDNDESLVQRIREQKWEDGTSVFTPLVAYGFMLFILLYFPCIATIAAIRRESSRRWAVFTVFYTTSVAWLVAFIVYQIGLLL